MQLNNKGPIVLFGRSPFINKLDIPRIMRDYPTIGHNQFGQHYDVDYLFFYDRWYAHGNHQTIFYPHWFNVEVPTPPPKNCQPFRRIKQDTLATHKQQDALPNPDGPLFAFKYFSPSVSINWAYLAGYSAIYLVGIDNVETDKQFMHHDGQDMESCLSPKVHKAFKQYVQEAAKQVTIIQTNPAVAKDWDLIHIDFEAQYGKT